MGFLFNIVLAFTIIFPYPAQHLTMKIGKMSGFTFVPFSDAQTVSIGEEFLYTFDTDWKQQEVSEPLFISLDRRLEWFTVGSQTCSGVSYNPNIQTCPARGFAGPGHVWIWVRLKPTTDISPLVSYARYKGDTTVILTHIKIATTYLPVANTSRPLPQRQVILRPAVIKPVVRTVNRFR